MKFAIAGASIGRWADPANACELARVAEARGFESLWTADRVAIVPGESSGSPFPASVVAYPDSLVWIAHVAAVTTTLRFGTGVLLAPLYNPILLARAAATVDVLSRGRLELGVGLGWSPESYETLGVDWATRGARLDDHIGAMRALWNDEEASFHGQFTKFEALISDPRPQRPNGVPIVIGGHSRAAAARAGRIGDGYFIGGHDFDAVPALIAVMHSSALEAGRDPDAIEVTFTGNWDHDTAIRYLEAGIHRLALPPPKVERDGVDDLLHRYQEETISQVS